MASTPSKHSLPKEWQSPPSPKSLEVLYLKTRKKHDEMKDELATLVKRIVNACHKEELRTLMLEGEPLVRVYDMFLDVVKEQKAKEVPVVILPDSSSSDA